MIFAGTDFVNVGGMHSGWLERVADGSAGVQDSDKTVQNLTDCADKSSVSTVCEKNSSGRAHSFAPKVPLVSSRIEKTGNLKEAETPDNGVGHA